MTKKVLVLLGLVVLLSVLSSAQDFELLLKDNMRIVNNNETSGGGTILGERYLQVNGKESKAIKLFEESRIKYDEPYTENIEEGWLEIWFKPVEHLSTGLVDFDTLKDDFESRYGVFLVGRYLVFEEAAGGAQQVTARNKIKMREWNHLLVHWDSNEDCIVIHLNGKITSECFSSLEAPGRRPVIYLGSHWYYGQAEEIIFDKLKIIEGDLSPNAAQEIYNEFLEA